MTAATNLQRSYPVERQYERPVHRTAKRARPVVNFIPVTIICSLLVLGLSLGYVGQKVRLMRLTYELAQLQNELGEAEREYGYLQLEQEKASSPRQVEKVARERLGMTAPAKVEYLVLAGSVAAQEEASSEIKPAPGIVRSLAAWIERHWPRGGAVEAARRN